ncbi:MAG: PPC domain-containing protein, partial [Planctomycetota bacterium]
MRLTASVLLLGLLPCALLPCAHLAAQRSNAHPLLQGLVPRGGQRGTEVTLNLYGRRLGNVQGIYQLEDGIQLLEAKSLRNNRAQLRIKIRDDCRLGTHRLALRTGLGVSNLKTFHVGVLPEVSEAEPNNTLQQAQKIQLDVTVNGMVRAEDNDYFAIDVNAGQQVNFEVQGLRLADLEFDPYLRLLDANGNVLTQLDDSILGLFDPWGSYTFKKAGTYVVHVRETAFGGSNNSHYRLHIGSFPRPSVVFPPGGRPGELLKTTAIGPAGRQPLEVRLPAQPDPRYRHHVVTETGTSPTPILLCVNDLPAQLEPSLGGVATARPAPKPATLGPWHFLGPFAWRKDKPRVYPPEEQPNPPRLPLKTDFVGRDGVIRWRRLGGVRDDRVFDLRKAVPKSNGCVVFLHRQIRSPSKRRALFLLSGDDELNVWLNGKRVHQSKSRRAAQNAHRLFLGLRQGQNQLLLKLTNAGGGFGFQARVLEPHRDRGLGFLVAPLAVHGILSKAGESDRFRFHAQKGQRLDIRVIARQLRSPLDAVLHVTSSTDRFYVGSDDVGRNMDSLVRFNAPHTGEFNVTLVDRLGR